MHSITLASIKALNPTCLVLLNAMMLAKTKMSGNSKRGLSSVGMPDINGE